MSELVPTRLIVFGERLVRRRIGLLEICELPVRTRWKDGSVNPLSEQLALYVPLTHVIHAHQYHSVVTNLLLGAGRLSGRSVFVTDHGGASYNYADRWSLERFVSGFLPVSRFSAGFFPQLWAKTSDPLLGGADLTRFHPSSAERRREVVYVGRLLPHKGVDFLLRAVDDATPVRIFGRSYDPAYRFELERLARGKDVVFNERASDEDIADAYRSARVAVLPSVYKSSDGVEHPWPELLGLTLIEAMASGTPVIASRVGGMPEIVQHDRTGFLVEPGNVAELGERIAELIDSARWDEMSQRALEVTRTELNWKHVAEQCLKSYERYTRRRRVHGRR
jgi:glycosyltransferase involved in cell wall biosynthesis